MSTGAHDLSAADTLTRVTALARSAVSAWPELGPVEVTLLNLSENATYLLSGDDGRRHVLRVHRLGYHGRAAIESELTWMEALRADAGIRTPEVVRSAEGRRIIDLVDPTGGPVRHAVLFGFVEGREPDESDGDGFETMGEITARMHRHARSWATPPSFTRFAWDHDAAFGAESRWGRWRDGVGIGPGEAEVLGRLAERLRERLARFGTGPERYGLIHADTRLANLLVDGTGHVTVIDFDDCGYGWYLYDLGTTVSFFEDAPQVPELLDRWLTGYRRVLELGADDEAEIWTFVLFRRLLLVAWIGSHGAVELARQLGAGYTAASCELAEWYLGRFG